MTDSLAINAEKKLSEHLKEIIDWHFSPETGTEFWLNWAKENQIDPRGKVSSLSDLSIFPNFEDEWLRIHTNEKWVPKKYRDIPFKVFETGGTTGVPKQRVSWEDHLTDYTEFSSRLDQKGFPLKSHWLMLGPTGPRRLRLSIEHLANIRGGSCYFVDMDPRWVKKLITDEEYKQAEAYKAHAIDQAVAIIKHRNIKCLFTTPKLLESLAEKISIPESGIKGVFCGGTTMTPQYVRFIMEEVLENKTVFCPTYGNTLMGLACHKAICKEDNYSVTYYAPQPRAILRVINVKNNELVSYGEYGRVELTTLTKEFFMPRFLERDEAIRREPCEQFPWDGVADVRPFGGGVKKIVEGVY